MARCPALLEDFDFTRRPRAEAVVVEEFAALSSTASLAFSSITMPDEVVPTVPGSKPPWPASRNTTRCRAGPVGAYSMQVPGLRALGRSGCNTAIGQLVGMGEGDGRSD